MISSFWVAVQFRSPRQPFEAPTAGQSWVRSPEAGPRAYFRLLFPIPDTPPQGVTLFVEGFQQVTAYVNNVKVEAAQSVPNNLVDTAPDIPKLVSTIDIRPDVFSGGNAVGLEVVSLDGQPPAFRARLEVRTGSRVQVYGVSPASWASTTNAALTNEELPESGSFSKRYFEDGDWVPAVPSSSRPGTATVTVPPDAFTRPADAPALTGSFGAQSLVASTYVTFPTGCTEGFLRVAATGNYTVSLDGREIAAGGAGTTPGVLPLSIYDLCPVASPGRHLLTVSVGASGRPAAYLDGYVRSGAQVATFATGPGWHSRSGSLVGTMNSPETELGLTFDKVPSGIIIPSGQLLVDHLTLTMELLLAALVAVVLALALGVPLAGAATAVVGGILPAIGVVLLLTETRHIVYVQPPFPQTPAMLALVLGVAAVGVVVAVAAAVWHYRRAPDEERRAGARHRRRGWLATRWYQVAVTGLATGWALVQSYHIMFNPLWQDELSSLAAAQGIRAHLIPEWPSGFLYWKSELFSALIAVIGGIAHDNPSVLHDVSVFWFGATILVFGLFLVPLVLKGRRVYQLVATVVFATAPFEMGHAQDIRMYQMLQCVVVVVAVLLFYALRTRRPDGWRADGRGGGHVPHPRGVVRGARRLPPGAVLQQRPALDAQLALVGLRRRGGGSDLDAAGAGQVHPPTRLRRGPERRTAGGVVPDTLLLPGQLLLHQSHLRGFDHHRELAGSGRHRDGRDPA